jgi:hypothetical protein
MICTMKLKLLAKPVAIRNGETIIHFISPELCDYFSNLMELSHMTAH